jgi:hypothetical protein
MVPPGGWDGRSRMSSIDTKKCPVYMLTGEYDWSNTPEMGQATCDKITGGKHQAMKGVGHFPATENPKVFVPYRKYYRLSAGALPQSLQRRLLGLHRMLTLFDFSVGGCRTYPERAPVRCGGAMLVQIS